MANFDGSKKEDFVQCPYNVSHIIERYRMPAHLTKCRKQYPNQKMETCLFNSCHIVPEKEFKMHCELCDDRYKVDTLIFRSEDAFAANKFPVVQPTSSSYNRIEPEEEECWDNMNVQSYDPAQRCENAPVLRQLTGGSKKERRQFKEQERRRLANLRLN